MLNPDTAVSWNLTSCKVRQCYASCRVLQPLQTRQGWGGLITWPTGDKTDSQGGNECERWRQEKGRSCCEKLKRLLSIKSSCLAKFGQKLPVSHAGSWILTLERCVVTCHAESSSRGVVVAMRCPKASLTASVDVFSKSRWLRRLRASFLRQASSTAFSSWECARHSSTQGGVYTNISLQRT